MGRPHSLVTASPFIALTDLRWFEFLSSRAQDGRLDEANFWSPRSTRPMLNMQQRHPVFLRLKSPHHAIAGYGFFAHFCALRLDEAWQFFGWKNGDPDEASFLRRIGRYRGVDLLDARQPRAPLGCTLLRDLRLWPRERWIPWGARECWKQNIVRGRSEDDAGRASRLLGEIAYDGLTTEEFEERFVLADVDERELVLAQARPRIGQGTFRSRLLDAYGRRCAITGERTEPVLDAAHIQPYLGPGSNHLQNGILLTKEFHALFDKGYVGITPDHRVLVSDRLHQDWENGRRYYAFRDHQLEQVPSDPRVRPSEAALEWHLEKVFLG